MTAVGLLLTGTPGWLLLGILMGVLELVPYIGPVLAGVPAVLLLCAGMHLPKIFGYPCNRNTGKKMQESLLQKYRFMIY